MAVAHDAASESHTGTTGASTTFSWTHSPSGTPRGVVVFVHRLGNSADGVTGVTYGGTAMTAVPGGRAVDTVGETISTKTYFLGTSVPTGDQTVEVTCSGSTQYAVCATVTAGADTEVTGIVLLEGDDTLTEQSVDDGSIGIDSVRYAAASSGLNSPPAAGASSTLLFSFDPGTQTTAFVRETTAGQGSRSVGFSNNSEDRAVVHLAIREKVSPSGTGAVTTTAATVSGTGSHVANPSGTGAVSLPATTTSGTGAETFTATGDVTTAAATTDGTGAETFTATGATTHAAATVDGTGDHTEGAPPSGTGAVSLAATTVDATGSLGLTGTGAAALAAMVASGTGAIVLTGSGAIALPGVTTDGSGLLAEAVTGTGAVDLAGLTVSGTGSLPVAADDAVASHVARVLRRKRLEEEEAQQPAPPLSFAQMKVSLPDFDDEEDILSILLDL